ncbi:hypothetical protein Asppvi_005334 [Aspergillus pseudoviridinutans]|uniref:Dipeptidase n=1 Tax=Aspergillus pseudoviridinutans TaxID=1517512 RepID=A0A9P3BBT9_9EURO|nr:uncharacterized protein Asppvi_005334 [Aspergillus pseudoviridinutans]GIJ86445.1 hypothetical protein Asppvi_005334 [Aspergillus pseudoviridinutans]
MTQFGSPDIQNSDKAIWYFAYGSNIKSSVMKARGITPLCSQAVVVPSHILCFDIFGIPYAEPSFASIAPMPDTTAGSTNSKVHQTLLPVHGVAYLLTPDDYRRLVLTEGAGVGYNEITVTAGPVADLHTDKREILVHTLEAKYPWRPNRAPSARYMGLILEGAEEFKLPTAYRAYLESLPRFERPQTLRGRFGACWFLAFWRRAIRILARLTKNQGPDDSNERHTYRLKAQRLLQQVPLIDGHNDFPWMLRGHFLNDLSKGDLNHLTIGQTDIARLRRGMVGGQFWSAFVPWWVSIKFARLQEDPLIPKQPESFPDEAHWKRLRDTLQQIDVIHRMLEAYPHVFGLAESAAAVWSIFRSGRIASLIGIEGLHQITDSPSILRTFHRLGVRYASLSHTSNNPYSDSATDSALHHGLSVDGKRMIEEMNRVGVYDHKLYFWEDLMINTNGVYIYRIVDLSHTSEAAQHDALAISRAPVIFSHSACYALVPHRRNVSDRVLQLLKKNQGVVMICCLRELVDRAGGAHATRKQVVDHVVYVGETIGFDHVGIGSDFDGMLEGPDGLDDVSHFPALVEDLLRRGVSESAVQKVLGLNILRVLKQVEDIALQERLFGSTKALCDDIDPVWTPEQREILRAQGKKRGLWQPDEY